MPGKKILNNHCHSRDRDVWQDFLHVVSARCHVFFYNTFHSDSLKFHNPLNMLSSQKTWERGRWDYSRPMSLTPVCQRVPHLPPESWTEEKRRRFGLGSRKSAVVLRSTAQAHPAGRSYPPSGPVARPSPAGGR